MAHIEALPLAEIALEMGAGRKLKTDVLDMAAGVELLVKRGDKVEKGQPWLRLHHNNRVPEVSLYPIVLLKGDERGANRLFLLLMCFSPFSHLAGGPAAARPRADAVQRTCRHQEPGVGVDSCAVAHPLRQELNVPSPIVIVFARLLARGSLCAINLSTFERSAVSLPLFLNLLMYALDES